jgi:hypothetical protein
MAKSFVMQYFHVLTNMVRLEMLAHSAFLFGSHPPVVLFNKPIAQDPADDIAYFSIIC